MQGPSLAQSREHSEDFNAFMRSALDAEVDLSDEAAALIGSTDIETLAMPSSLGNGTPVRRPVDELNLPSRVAQDTPCRHLGSQAA